MRGAALEPLKLGHKHNMRHFVKTMFGHTGGSIAKTSKSKRCD